jgi:hypothetical protein
MSIDRVSTMGDIAAKEPSAVGVARFKRGLLPGVLAFAGYGGWAAFANVKHGARAAVAAGCTQGLMSFTVTTFMTLAMGSVFRRLPSGGLRLLLTALGPCSLVLVLMATIHDLVGTPEILRTILPSAIVGYTYCGMYTGGLHARAKRM